MISASGASPEPVLMACVNAPAVPRMVGATAINEGLLPKGWWKAFDIAPYLLRR